jgi:hypothetical protein
MELNNEKFLDDRDNQSKREHDKPNAWRVNDDNNLKEKDLERNLYRNNKKPIMEGQAAGGQNFGKNNLTPAGDDKNNPSQNAGHTNAYFARTEPSEEHPEDSNFKLKNQDGQPDYDKAQAHSRIMNDSPKPEKVERGYGENDRPKKSNTYYEGTADNDNEPNIAEPNEMPDQWKVGEDADDEREHIET